MSGKKKAKKHRRLARDIAPALMLVASDALPKICRRTTYPRYTEQSWWVSYKESVLATVPDNNVAPNKFYRAARGLLGQEPDARTMALLVRNIIALREKHL